MLKLNVISLENINQIGLTRLPHKNFPDERGYLQIETEISIEKTEHLIIKESYSKKNVGRGLHFQTEPFPQTKIIQVKQGCIFDLVYCPYGNDEIIFAFYLSHSDKSSVLIPDKFSHGFIALDDTVFTYTCLGRYSEKHEMTFNVLENVAELMGFGQISLSVKDTNQKKLAVTC